MKLSVDKFKPPKPTGMPLSKAIKQLEDALADKWCPWSQELKDSIRLGIEAMERYKEQREADCWIGTYLLEEETEE